MLLGEQNLYTIAQLIRFDENPSSSCERWWALAPAGWKVFAALSLPCETQIVLNRSLGLEALAVASIQYWSCSKSLTKLVCRGLGAISQRTHQNCLLALELGLNAVKSAAGAESVCKVL